MQAEKFILSNDVVEVGVGERTAVYHRQLGALCFLDTAAREVLNGFREAWTLPHDWLEGDAPTREAELIQQLVARSLIIKANLGPPVAEQQAPVEKKVNIIQLILANACNFGCTYCFEGIQGKELSVEAEVAKIDTSRLRARDDIKVNINDSMYASKERFEHQYDPKNRNMKPDDAVRYVENALAVSRSSGVRAVMIQFFGGEPLLNWKAIAAVLERFGNGERDDMSISYSTVTNGS